MKLGYAVKQVEEFQEQNDRHFGSSSTDFRTLFWRLVRGKFPGSLLQDESESNLDKVNLQEVALDTLKYQDAYFNDEGEHWCIQQDNPVYIPYLYDRSEEEFNARQSVIKSIIGFFQGLEGKTCPAKQVQALIIKCGFSCNTLYACSRPGDAS